MEDLSSSITFSSVPCRRIHFSHMYTYVSICNGVKLFIKCIKFPRHLIVEVSYFYSQNFGHVSRTHLVFRGRNSWIIPLSSANFRLDSISTFSAEVSQTSWKLCCNSDRKSRQLQENSSCILEKFGRHLPFLTKNTIPKPSAFQAFGSIKFWPEFWSKSIIPQKILTSRKYEFQNYRWCLKKHIRLQKVFSPILQWRDSLSRKN